MIGKRIGHYLVVARLGEGGAGQIYEGFDEKLKRSVALKCIRDEHRMKSEAKIRFLREGRVKVLDFGLSRVLLNEETVYIDPPDAVAGITRARFPNEPELQTESGTSRPELFLVDSCQDLSVGPTIHRTIMGTLGYMSPEQACVESASSASDLYSFGLVLQELFTGRPTEAQKIESRLADLNRGVIDGEI